MFPYRLLFRRQIEVNRAYLEKHGLIGSNALPLPLPLPPQGHALFRGLRYGLKPMSYNGCEVIACCHALLYFDRPCDIASTAEFCAGAGLWLLGLFGTHPHTLYTFCRKYGFAYRRYSGRRLPPANAEDCFLYSYWNPRFRGIHTVTVYRDKAAGQFVVTNHGGLRGMRFPTAAAALHAIPTAAPILCLGIKNA